MNPKLRELLLPPSPHETTKLYGRIQQQRTFVTSLRKQRLHHAFLFYGPKSIGKATLAWHMARFAMIYPNGHPDGGHLDGDHLEPLLTFPQGHPLVKQTGTGVYQDMVFLTTTKNSSIITVEQMRTMQKLFFEKSAHRSYRVCLIDSVDDLNLPAANALLKILEEPPSKSLFLLISHKPEGILKTIVSRCIKTFLMPLSVKDGEKVINACLATVSEKDRGTFESKNVQENIHAMLKKGNLQRAFLAATSQVYSYRKQIDIFLERGDPESIFALTKSLGRLPPFFIEMFVEDFGDVLVECIKSSMRLASQEKWQKLNALFDDFITTWSQCFSINMDKSQVITSFFLRLANVKSA